MNQDYVFKLSDEERDILYEELNTIPYDPNGATSYITMDKLLDCYL